MRIVALELPAHAQRKGHVFEHSEMRPDRIGLEHHSHVALVDRHQDVAGRRRKGAPQQRDLTGIGRLQAGEQTQRGSLATAGRAEEGEEFTRRDGESDSVNDRGLAVTLHDVRKFEKYVTRQDKPSPRPLFGGLLTL